MTLARVGFSGLFVAPFMLRVLHVRRRFARGPGLALSGAIFSLVDSDGSHLSKLASVSGDRKCYITKLPKSWSLRR